jgi:hypothetical protein
VEKQKKFCTEQGVEKQKKFCTEQWFLLVNFRTVATNVFLKKLGYFLKMMWIQEKNDPKTEKLDKCTNNKIGKKEKKHWDRGIYMCAL